MSSDFSDTAQRKQLLRLAVQNPACAPQAQRRYGKWAGCGQPSKT